MRGSQPPAGDLIRFGALTNANAARIETAWTTARTASRTCAGGRRRAIAPKATRPLPLTNPERHRLKVKRCPPAGPGRAGVKLP